MNAKYLIIWVRKAQTLKPGGLQKIKRENVKKENKITHRLPQNNHVKLDISQHVIHKTQVSRFGNPLQTNDKIVCRFRPFATAPLPPL